MGKVGSRSGQFSEKITISEQLSFTLKGLNINNPG